MLQPIRISPPRNAAQRRHGSFWVNARKLFNENPFSVTLASVLILFGAGCLGYVNYVYQEYIIKAFHKYPEPVAKKMRRAIYYANYDVQPKEALKYFKQALALAEELRMDPFSDEILGVKIEIARMLERIGQHEMAVEVLERIRASNLAWLEESGGEDHNKKRRTRVLAKTIAITVKIGELYSTPEVWKRDMAQERLVWAVDISLKERLRRISQNVTEEEEGEWLSDDEMGAQLESLAHSYEAKDLHYLAAPLFLQALSLYPAKDCHQVVLMNNLASSLAQQSPQAAREVQAYVQSHNIDQPAIGPEATREMMVQNAKTWAEKAIEVAAAIQPPERTEECDVGCAVATHNLGEFAEMSNDIVLAEKYYKESVSLARAVGFQEGVEQSSTRLRALAKAG